jgi:hypothetical protein
VCDAEQARERADEIRLNLGALFADRNFDELIRRATGDRTRMLGRIRETATAFEEAGVSANIELLGNVAFPPRP